MTQFSRQAFAKDASHVPVVSIVVNNYNYARFLKQSVDSALTQTHPYTEVVVVDDASTDGSQELIRTFGNRIIPVFQSANSGQGAAMNAGFAACNGDVIIYLDADDYLYPNTAESVARLFRSDVAVIQYRLHLVDVDGNLMDLYPRPEVQFDTGDVRKKLAEAGRFEGTVTSGLAFGRKSLAAVLPISSDSFRISADGYLLTTVPFFGDVLAIEQPLGAYRLHGGNLWSTTSNMAVGFRRSILHDFTRYRELVSRASPLGLQVAKEPGLRDYQHISARLCSLVLEPDKHPTPNDSRVTLGIRGAVAVQRASLSWRFRALLTAWFIAVGTLPQSWSQALLRLRYQPTSRSLMLQRVLKSLRPSSD